MTISIRALGFALAVAAGLPMAAQARADTATDALSACLVKSATAEDRIVLTRWVFAAISRHPGVADLATLNETQVAQINKAGGALFSRLLIENCQAETVEAVKADGANAIGAAFSVLGQTAMEGLADDPTVQSSLMGLAPYIDQEKLLKVLADAAAAQK